MKKFFAVLLAVVMILGCVSALAEGEKIALVTDVGTIDDESFNQACWQAVEAFAIENDVEYTYYQPNADSLDARLMSIDQAVTEGASVIVMPGYLFGATLVTAQDKYPDVKFIAVDVSAGDLTVDYTNYVEPAANVVCVTFSEEQAGFLAGYAAVKDGYTKLGFLGGMAVPAVIRYGYGFVQGADKAAAELDKQIEINYTYGGQVRNYSLQEGDYVGLPTAEASWRFATFTAEDYAAIYGAVQSGEVVVSNDTENAPAVTNATVNYIQ